MNWKDEIKKDVPEVLSYNTARLEKRLKTLKKYIESLVGKEFTSGSANTIQNYLLSIINNYDEINEQSVIRPAIDVLGEEFS